jgi:hypothetical protein
MFTAWVITPSNRQTEAQYSPKSRIYCQFFMKTDHSVKRSEVSVVVIVILWTVTPCSLAGGYKHSREHTASIFRAGVCTVRTLFYYNLPTGPISLVKEPPHPTHFNHDNPPTRLHGVTIQKTTYKTVQSFNLLFCRVQGVSDLPLLHVWCLHSSSGVMVHAQPAGLWRAPSNKFNLQWINVVINWYSLWYTNGRTATLSDLQWLVNYDLYHDTVSSSQYTVSNDWMIMKGYRRKWLWPWHLHG